MDAYSGIPRWMSTLEFQDGCLPWNSKMDVYPRISRWMPTLEFQDECLNWNSKMDPLPGIPRWMLTLEIQDECLPWNSKMDAYLITSRWRTSHILFSSLMSSWLASIFWFMLSRSRAIHRSRSFLGRPGSICHRKNISPWLFENLWRYDAKVWVI